MMLLTTADALGRYLFNRPILAAYELTTNYLMVGVVFLALPYAYREGANIRVTFLVDRLGRTARGPPAFSATFPPSDDCLRLAGSGG